MCHLPSETLKEVLNDLNIPLIVFSESVDMPYEDLLDVIDAKKQIDERTAKQFENVLNIPSKFWLNLEKNYQATLRRINSQ